MKQENYKSRWRPRWSLSTFLMCLHLISPILTAADDPARLVVRPDSSIVVAESRISFFCRADGNPLPSVVWKVNSQPASDINRFIIKSLPSGLSTLRIEPVRQSDNNTVVSCSADNGVANPVVAEAILTVIPRDDTPQGFPYIDGHPTLKSVEQGRTAHVTCRVHGDPRPKVLWLRDLVPIDIRSEGRYSLSTMGNPGALMIQQAKEEDQGKYECVARNSHGVVHSKAAHLYVKVRRVPPYFSMKLNPIYAVGMGGSVNLTCVAVGYPMPRVFWKKSDDVALDDPATAPIGKNVLSLSNIESTENFTCVAVSKLGNIETTTTVIVKDLPLAPKNFQIISVSHDSVTLSWSQPKTEEPILNFLIKYQQKSKSVTNLSNAQYASSSSVREKIVEPEATSVTISGLEAYQLYEFTIYTISDVGPGIGSIPKEAETEEASPASPPIKVQARSLSRDSLLVQWSPSERPNGLITGYKIYFTDLESSLPVDKWKNQETKSDELMATLYNLNVDQKYYIHVQAFNSKGKSPLSSLITVSTIYGLPAQPPNLAAKVLDARRVQLTWSKPLHSSPVTGYMIHYNDTDGEKEITLTSPYEKHLVTGLEANSNYAFRVSARSSRGFGEFSESVTVKTKEDAFTGPPLLKSVEALSASVLRVMWLPPEEHEYNLTSYRLSYRIIPTTNSTRRRYTSSEAEDEDDDEDEENVKLQSLKLGWQYVIVSANHTEYDLTELISYSLYEVRVSAATTSGYGPESLSLRMSTHEDDGVETRLDVPSQPLNFDVDLISPTIARYTWEAPKNFVGNGGYYLYADKLINGQPEAGALRKKKVVFDKKASHAEVDDLEPNTEYSFRMNAFNFHGDGEFTQTKILLTGGLPPRQPEIQSVVLLSEDSPLKARVDWKRPELKPLESPIEKFHIWYRADGSDKKTHVTVDGTKSSVELKGLWMGRIYEITLAAENIEGKSENATEKLETPTGLPDGEPLHVQYEINEDTMRISWDPPEEEKRNGNISSYKAILTPMDAEGARKEVTVEELQHSFKVDTRKAYTFKVAASTMKGLGPYSPVLTINPDPSALVGPPTNVRVEATSNTSVIVQWDFDGGPVDGFVVRYMHEPNQRREDRWISRTVQSSATRHLSISQLTAHKPYAFCVMAIKNNRQGACSDPPTIIKSVTPEYMVTDLEVVWKTSQSVNLRWKYNGPQPVGFYFHHTGQKEYFDQTMTLKNMTTPGYKRELPGDRTEFLLTSLRPYMSYTLQVGVYSQATQRYYWPQEVEVMTDPTAPPYVAAPILMAGDYKNGLIPVHLQPSTEEYGPISHYWLIVLPGNFTPEDVMNLEPITLQRLTDEKRKALAKQISASPTKKFKREISTVLDTEEDLVDRKRMRRDIPNTAYVTARLKPEDLRTYKPFMIGDEKIYDGFTNFPLEPNNKYRLMMRAFAKEHKAHQLKQRPPMSENPAKMYSDSNLSDVFSTQRGMRVGGKAGGMWLLGPMIALLIIGLLIGMLVCWWLRCNKKSAGRGHRHGSITKVALGGNIMNGGPGETSKLLSSDYGRPIMNPYEQMNSSGCMESSLDLYPMPTSHSRMANYGPIPVAVPCLPNNGGVIANHSVAHPIIPITELAAHIERLRMNNNAGFQMEFESIESGQNFTWDHSNMDYNKHKNRYANVVAYDHSRVSLTNIDEVPGGDYINANYIDGYDKPKTYIATQGPLPETFSDFWRMVWEEGSATIVMLTNLEERSRVKCDQYWPTRGTSVYGNIHVTLLETMVLAHYTMRTLRIQCSDEPEVREIRLLQYTAWPDHGVPDHPTPFLIFLKRVKTLNPPDAGPIISHCSAGIGRTGAFIAVDIMLERLRYESTVDIFGCVTGLRGQRSYMVQTEDQYVFIHDAVLDAVNSGSTEVPAAKLHQHLMQIRSMDGHGVSGIEMEFRHLSTLKWSNTRCAVANLPVNRHKNRQIAVVPFDSNRIILRAIPGVEGSDYVNASWVDGYRERGAYIATQAPMEQTIFDFWRMIWEHECAIVVMLAGNIELNRGDCIEYWPLENGTQVGNLVVEPLAEYNMPQYVMREFRLSDIQTGLSRTVRHFQFTDWPEQGPPKVAEMFIDFIQQVHRTKAQFGADGPIAVHCISGAGRTGVFIALSILLDRMRLEHVIDVFTTVKLLRTERQSMVRDKEQYEFLYQASLEFLSSYDQYAPS